MREHSYNDLNLVTRIPLKSEQDASAAHGSKAKTGQKTPKHSAPASQFSDGGVPQKQSFSRRDVRFLKSMHKWGVRAFGAVMAVGCITGLLVFAHPASSQLEGRQLTQFPEFSASSFLDGSYLEQVALWYSDTFPGRDVLVNLGQGLKGLYGIQPDTSMVGGKVQAEHRRKGFRETV